MKVKTILNLSTGLLTVGGASAGTYYALNTSKKAIHKNKNRQKLKKQRV